MIGEVFGLAGAAFGMCAAYGQAKESIRRAEEEALARIPVRHAEPVAQAPDGDSRAPARADVDEMADRLGKALKTHRLWDLGAALNAARQLQERDKGSEKVQDQQEAERDVRHLLEVGQLWLFVLVGALLAVVSAAMQVCGSF